MLGIDTMRAEVVILAVGYGNEGLGTDTIKGEVTLRAGGAEVELKPTRPNEDACPNEDA